MMKPLLKAYSRQFKDVAFTMERPLGSSGSIKALLAGALDIAVVSRPLKPEETAAQAKLTAYGKTPLAIVTNRGVPLKNITTRQLEDIYSGKTRAWPKGERIRIVLRPEADIDTAILKRLSPGMADAVDKARGREGMTIAVTDPESDKAVMKIPGAIGTSGLTGIRVGKLPLNIVSLNGVMPGPRTISDGAYPLAKDIGFVTTGRTSAAAVKFLKFVYSRQGRDIAEKTGVMLK